MNWLIKLLNDNSKMESALLSLDLSTESLMLARIPAVVPTSRDLSWFYSERLMCCCLRIPSSKDLELWVVKDFDQPVWLKHHVWVLELFLEDEGMLITKLCCKTVGFEYHLSSREWRSISFHPEDSLYADDGLHPLFPHVNSLVRCD